MARQGAFSVEELIKKKVVSFRRWKQTKLYKRHQKWGFHFSVMTYNILSQTAVENHRYLYKHCNHTYLQEDYRISRILPEILKSKSDIICLQEVEQHLFDNRIKQLFDSNGFESIFKKRTGCNTVIKDDGCAILWRRKKFNLLNYSEVEFAVKGNELLNRDNIGLIAVLKPNHPNSGNTLLHIATTHLLFNPRRGDIKFCQLRLFFAELEKMALKEVRGEERFYHPIIFCGDFNIDPHSPLYQFIDSGFIDITTVMSGDLSGQAEGKSRGRLVTGKQLSMQELGISDTCRFEKFSESTLNMRVSIVESNKPSKSDTNTLSISYPQSSVNSRPMSESLEPGVASAGCDFKCNEIRFSHDFKFVPAYKFHQFNQGDMPVTSMTGNDFDTVDHIFYNVQNKKSPVSYTEGQLRLLQLYSLMRADEINDIGGLPNAYLGSDHICLNAKFALCFSR